MITERAKMSFDTIFPRCMEEALSSDAHQNWDIQAVSEKDITAKQFIMLTVSSYEFRLIVLFHFSSDATSRQYVLDVLNKYAKDNEKVLSTDLTVSKYYDFLSELGNLMCGVLKREIFQFYPHLGLSTPNILTKDSQQYVNGSPIDHAIHMKASTDDDIEFYGSIYVSSSGTLDFDPAAAINKSAEVVDTGALELF
jgi:hypothetical protein